MRKVLSRLKESFGEGVVSVNLPPNEKYYFEKGIERDSMEEHLKHLIFVQNVPMKNILDFAIEICPSIDISLCGEPFDKFINDMAKLLEYSEEAYPESIIVEDSKILIPEEREVLGLLSDGVNALYESYEAPDKLEEAKDLDTIIWKDMDDSDVELAYYMATGRKPNNAEDGRNFIKNDVISNKNGKIARVLSSSFLRDYSFKEALEEVPLENVKRCQETGISLFESKNSLGKITREGKNYKITKFKF